MPDIVILAVEDLARATALYRSGLGLRPVVEAPVYVELEGGVGLYQRDGFARNIGATPARLADRTAPGAAAGAGGEQLDPAAPPAITATELYFRVPDLDAVCRRLEAAGARLLSPAGPRPWGEVVAYYADLDGNVVAVAQQG